jgi:putative flippase GtrA
VFSPDGVSVPPAYVQAFKFGAVGLLGVVLNLAAYSLEVAVLGIPALVAAVGAFCVAVINNHLLNRVWTFQERDAAYLTQGARFLAVSLGALLVNLTVLDLLISAGAGRLEGQLLAILATAPVAFIGNRNWTFRPHS